MTKIRDLSSNEVIMRNMTAILLLIINHGYSTILLRLRKSSAVFRGVAQLAARLVWDQDAGGSSPLTPTSREYQQILPFAMQKRT